jgi:hypothetical protein
MRQSIVSATLAIITAAGLAFAAAPASAATSPGTLSNTGATVKFWADAAVFLTYDTLGDNPAAPFHGGMP